MANLSAQSTNVTDQTRREHYLLALNLKRELEDAEAKARVIRGRYRAALKTAEKAGIDPDDITRTLAVRMQDPEDVMRREQGFIRMMSVSGVMPTIQEDMFAALKPVELSEDEKNAMTLEGAFDEGHAAGLAGRDRGTNRHFTGTEIWEAWDRGWLTAQEKIAMGLGPKQKKPRAARKGKLDPSQDDGAAVH